MIAAFTESKTPIPPTLWQLQGLSRSHEDILNRRTIIGNKFQSSDLEKIRNDRELIGMISAFSGIPAPDLEIAQGLIQVKKTAQNHNDKKNGLASFSIALLGSPILPANETKKLINGLLADRVSFAERATMVKAHWEECDRRDIAQAASLLKQARDILPASYRDRLAAQAKIDGKGM